MDPIKHVVLLMLENHSFDEMLGCFQAKYPELDGIDAAAQPRANLDDKGDSVFQMPKTAHCMRFDPKHERQNVMNQLAGGNAGFIKDFIANYSSSSAPDRDNIMGYYPRGFLPALHTLAEDFTICDRWFSSLPGPTWPNRFFALSGTSSGRVLMPEGLAQPHLETIKDQVQDTIFDRLDQKGRTWKIYYYDFPSSLIFEKQRRPQNLSRYANINDFFHNAAHGNEASYPDFVFIEPKYFGLDQNDDHPPHNVMKAEKLIGDVYNAISSNTSLWNTTLLIVVFDEHGGFYDHVEPPAAIPPDNKRTEYDFTRLGVRVPAILVSPYVERGVDHTLYDHTSVLKYLSEKWGLEMLGQRAAAANSIAGAISRTTPRPDADTTNFIRVPYSELVTDNEACVETGSSAHQEAIHVLAALIEKELAKDESPLLGEGVTLGAKLAQGWMQTKGWLGARFQSLGASLTAGQHRAESQRIAHTVNVADRLIRTGKS